MAFVKEYYWNKLFSPVSFSVADKVIDPMKKVFVGFRVWRFCIGWFVINSFGEAK